MYNVTDLTLYKYMCTLLWWNIRHWYIKYNYINEHNLFTKIYNKRLKLFNLQRIFAIKWKKKKNTLKIYTVYYTGFVRYSPEEQAPVSQTLVCDKVHFMVHV